MSNFKERFVELPFPNVIKMLSVKRKKSVEDFTYLEINHLWNIDIALFGLHGVPAIKRLNKNF